MSKRHRAFISMVSKFPAQEMIFCMADNAEIIFPSVGCASVRCQIERPLAVRTSIGTPSILNFCLDLARLMRGRLASSI